MRYALTIIMLIVAALAVVMLTGTGRREADFRFISRGGVQTLDPAQMSYMQDIQVAQTLWEGLTRLHPRTCEPIEGVAYMPPEISEDGRRYLFTLRPEARWSNGDPVTAADFLRGWRRAIEPGTADVYAELITNHVTGATAYADWRNAWVEVLGVIRLRQRSSPIKAESLAKALRGQAGGVLTQVLDQVIPEPLPAVQDPFWQTCVVRLEQAQADWKALGDHLLDKHIAEMESRFSQVGIRMLDDHRIEVHLQRPTPFILDLTAFSTYMPVHESIELLRERYEDRPLSDTGIWAYDPQWTKPRYRRHGYTGLITNGPYMLTEWVFKQNLRYEANPFYWDQASVRSQVIESFEVEYQNAGFLLYEQGLVDMMLDLAMDYTPELVRQGREGRRDDIHSVPSFGTFYLTFNCRPLLNDGHPNPVADPRVRRALSLAIDRQAIVDHVVRLDNPVATTFVPRGQIPGYRSPAGLSYDPERARRELADAGYPEGRGLPVVEYLYNTGSNQEGVAQALKRMWERELGVRVELVGKETKAYSEDKTEHRFTISRGGWFGDYMDPTTFLDLYQSENGHNSAGYDDPRFDALLGEAAREPDPRKRLDLLSEAERQMVEEGVPMAPIFVYVMVYTWRPNVVGVYPNPRAQFPTQYIGVEREKYAAPDRRQSVR
ncbi:MAG: peptide ABC transporter substrate-binding protein [Phycisphaerae bacterium]|nr:peptide ABC transporter substrate-binding protein [Phycisphaerae bacterium]